MESLTVVARLRNSGECFRSRFRFGVLIVPAALCALLAMFLATPASAAVTHLKEPFSPLTGSGSGLTLTEPQAVAIDEATGNVFVSDNNRVAILGAEGGAPVGLTSPFEIPGISFGEFSPAGLAYDNSGTGTLYAYDAMAHSIKKYTRNATSEKYEPAGEIANPNFSAVGLSVDTAGDLYVGSGLIIYKYSPSGTLLTEYDLSESSSGAQAQQVAVDSGGDLFVAGRFSGLYKFPADGSGEIDLDVYSQITDPEVFGVTIDSASDEVYAARTKRVTEYDAASGSKISEFGTEEIKSIGRIVVNSATERIYVADTSVGLGGKAVVNVFGPPVVVPTTSIGAASNVTATKATLNGTVNPEGVAVTNCFFEYGTSLSYGATAPCEGSIPTDSSNHFVTANISGLSPNGVTYHYRLAATNENGTEHSADQTLTTVNTVVTEDATAVNQTIATLHGTVRPEGSAYTECKFEYGLSTSPGFEAVAPCNPPFGSIPADFVPHAVSAALTGLQPNATYRFRLTAKNGSVPVSGEVLTFSATGPPLITEVRALNADQTSATIEAKVNPRSFQTNYFFEWGPTTAYGNRLPVSLAEPSVGAGELPVPVTAALSGLAPATAYHYRVVAHSNAGITASPDHELETLNTCATLGRPGFGLPEGRCFELVSQREAGPFAIPAFTSPEEIDFQATPQPGSLDYVVAAGLPGATRGGEVLYQARRGEGTSGWTSSQVSPPVLSRNETLSANSNPAQTLGLSEDLSCGVVESNQPLTPDPSTRAIVAAGGLNLYRHNPDGSYSSITNLPPVNPEVAVGFLGSEYLLAGFSRNCSKVVFSTRYQYPGVPAAGLQVVAERRFLYEWNEGTLRGVGVVPASGGGETAIGAIPGAKGEALPGGILGSSFNNLTGAVSADGRRVIFSAERQTSGNAGEVGKVGVFVRENGTTTRDVSLSETATPDLGATYQYATKDGARVFFTANAGLTAESSSEGIDLYEYNLASNRLTDLSVDHDPDGAGVVGFIGASQDGSHVYFVARGQLVPGRGVTFAENAAANTLSVYGAVGGVVSYVGQVTQANVLNQGLTVGRQDFARTARVSPSGRYLLFQSSANVTGYVSGGVPEAYLYDAGAATEATVCVSCRQDGKASVTPLQNSPLHPGSATTLNPLYDTTRLAIRNGKAIVFFTSFDRLAAGAEEGNANLYEWSHDQVFVVASAPRGLAGPESINNSIEEYVGFIDASTDGTDLYFWTPASLNWEDGDGRNSIYSARIGGGFVQPAAPPSPCNPTDENSCPGSPASPPPQAPSAGSTTFNGPGNPKPKKHKKHGKGHKKKQGKGHKKKQGQKKHKQPRQTSEHRRAGK